MATDWQALEAAGDHAYFMGELAEISPESFTLEEKRGSWTTWWRPPRRLRTRSARSPRSSTR